MLGDEENDTNAVRGRCGGDAVGGERACKTTALHYAMATGQTGAVKCLVESGANIEAGDEGGESALLLAVRDG